MANADKELFIETLRDALFRFYIEKELDNAERSELDKILDFSNAKIAALEKNLENNNDDLKKMIKLMRSDQYQDQLNDEYLLDKEFQKELQEVEEAGGEIDIYTALNENHATRYHDIVVASQDTFQKLDASKQAEFLDRLPMYETRLKESIKSGNSEDVERCLKAMENFNKRYEDVPKQSAAPILPGYKNESEKAKERQKTDKGKESIGDTPIISRRHPGS